MAEENAIYELGVDLNSSFEFQDGDLILAKYDENLVQAVTNQLNTELNELELFYEEYGSIIKSFLGWKSTDETLAFIDAELNTVLSSEDRLYNFETTVSYANANTVKIELNLYPNPATELTVDLVMDVENGVMVEE